MRGLNHDGEGIFRWSVECLRKRSNIMMEEKHQEILAMCLTAQGHCLVTQSYEKAKALAQESSAILRGRKTGKETILSLKLLESISFDGSDRLQLAQEALDIAKAGNSGWWLPKCTMDMGYFAMDRGDYPKAKALIQQARSLYNGTSNSAMDVQALLMLHQIALLEDDYLSARILAQECLEIAQDAGYSAATWWMHSGFADAALLQEEYTTAFQHYQAGLTICRELNEHRGAIFELSGLGSAACGLGDYAEACRYFCDALHLARDVGDLQATLDVLGGIAWLLASNGHIEWAVRLAIYVESQPTIELTARKRVAQFVRKFSLATIHTEDDVYQTNHDDIVSTLFQVLKQLIPEDSLPATSHSHPDALTERELEVLTLIAGGMSNYDIATQLFVGISTVKTHVNHIFSKLCVKNRTQAVARARELGLA